MTCDQRPPPPPPTPPPLRSRRRFLAQGLGSAAPVLLAATAPAFIRHAHAADTPRFAWGIASGTPRADRLVLWTRLSGPELPDAVPVDWELAEDEAFTRIAARGRETAERAWAHSVHAEPAGLQAGRPYWYRFSALGDRSPTGRTRTAPAPDAAATLRAAVASCQRWDHGHWAAWRDVAERAQAGALDLVLFVGDYLYEYASPPLALRRHEGLLPVTTLDAYRARYAQYKTDPALQAAHAALPWLLLWDDHEVQNDYANDVGQRSSGPDFLRQRAAAYQAWWEHQPVPLAMRPVGPDARIVQRLDWGRLARLHLLDDRQYRDRPVCLAPGRLGGSNTVEARDCAALWAPQRSLLGAEQEAWLNQGWDLQRPWNLLVQQTLMARASRTPVDKPEAAAPPPDDLAATMAAEAALGGRYWTDGWDGHPAARRRLLQAAADRRLGGLVVLGGDIHAHAVAALRPDFNRPASAANPVIGSEFCGSSISSHGSPQAQWDAIRRHNPHIALARSDQRGWLAITVAADALQAELRGVRDPGDAASAVDTVARFAVEPGRPGPQPA